VITDALKKAILKNIHHLQNIKATNVTINVTRVTINVTGRVITVKKYINQELGYGGIKKYVILKYYLKIL